jgi:hypothetical protein
VTGVMASALMLARIHRTDQQERSRSAPAGDLVADA